MATKCTSCWIYDRNCTSIRPRIKNHVGPSRSKERKQILLANRILLKPFTCTCMGQYKICKCIRRINFKL